MKKFWNKYKDKLIQIIFILLGIGGYATFDQLQAPTLPITGDLQDIPAKVPGIVVEHGFQWAVLVSVSRETTKKVEHRGRPGFEVTTKDTFVKALFFKKLSEITVENVKKEVEQGGIVFEDIVLLYPMQKRFQVVSPS